MMICFNTNYNYTLRMIFLKVIKFPFSESDLTYSSFLNCVILNEEFDIGI